MAARDVDIVIQSNGSNSFQPLGEAGVNTTLYDRAKKIRNLTRTLRSIGCGADPDLDSNLRDLLAEIDTATGGDLKRIGALCLYGVSNGAGLVLAVAKALQLKGAPKATYVGLGDLTMMPFGRNPPLPGIGSLQPVSAPDVSFGIRAMRGGVVLAWSLPPSVSDAPPPRIADPGVVGDKLENYYTAEGNRARIFKSSPAGAGSWWWTSTQHFGEVHGEVPGFSNIRRTTVSNGTILARGPGSIDEGHHDNLCGLALLAMRHEAGLALGGFVTNPPAP